jgi:hypothetical protein
MLRRLLATLGLGAAAAVAAAAPPYSPYTNPAANDIYNLLFCDDAASFRTTAGQPPVDWQVTLFAEPPDISALTSLASAVDQEGRVRALAYNRLRSVGSQVPKGVLLGVVVEVGLDGGLDTLAAFVDGGVRYINQTGKIAIFEGDVADTKPLVANLMQRSSQVVAKLGPSERVRQPPPQRGRLRLTFLVSDGLYGGEGTMAAMQQNSMSAPIVEAATQLLLKVVEMGTTR